MKAIYLLALFLFAAAVGAQTSVPTDAQLRSIHAQMARHPERWRDGHFFHEGAVGNASLAQYDLDHPNARRGGPPTERQQLEWQASQGDKWAVSELAELRVVPVRAVKLDEMQSLHDEIQELRAQIRQLLSRQSK